MDFAIKEYINNNLLSIYELKRVDLFIYYNNLLSSNRYNPSDTSINLLQRKNLFDDKISDSANLVNKFNSTIDSIRMIDTITFNQEKNSSDWNFNYYFNLYFNKI